MPNAPLAGLQPSPGTSLAILASGTNPDGTPFSLATSPASTAVANVLDGFQTFGATTAATTIITIPQGRTWVGTITVSCSCLNIAAQAGNAQALGVVTVAGVGVTPPAGSVFAVQALAAANAAGGTVGSQGMNTGATPLTVIAPAGNAVTIQIAATGGGSSMRVDCSAIGVLL